MNKFFTGIVICVLSFLNVQKGNAQNITMEETVKYINSKFDGKCKLEVIKGFVQAQFYEGREVYRKDKVAVNDLDMMKMGFEKEESLFFIPCKGDQEGCVERNLYVNKIKKQYSRLSFVVENNQKNIDGLSEAFIHLYKLVDGPSGYSRTKPFEQ